MRARIIVILSALAVLSAACGAGTGTETGPGIVLRYGYQPGDSVVYEVRQDISMSTSEGDPADPTVTTANSLFVGTSSYSFTEGPDPETMVLTTVIDLEADSMTIEVMGVVQHAPLPQIPRTEMTTTINARGEIVTGTIGGYEMPAGLTELLGGGQASGNQFVGPTLPEGPVTIGASWSEPIEMDTLGMSMRGQVESRLVSTEVVNGHDTFRIETTTSMEAMTIDMVEMFAALADDPDAYAAFFGQALSAEDLSSLSSELNMMRITGAEWTYEVEGSVSTMTTWLDRDSRVVIRAEMTVPSALDLSLTGVAGSDDMHMAMDMEMTYTFELME